MEFTSQCPHMKFNCNLPMGLIRPDYPRLAWNILDPGSPPQSWANWEGWPPGTQPGSFLYTLSAAAFTLRWQSAYDRGHMARKTQTMYCLTYL